MPKKKSSSPAGQGDGRTRNFTAILYPDSAPEDWLSILSELQIPMFISPLHDRDINPLTGEPKKPHYHLIICFDSVKTVDQAKAVFDLVKAVPPPNDRIKVDSIRGAVRYLCHMDNPEKAQYDTADVVTLAGADFGATISLVTDKYKAVSEMIHYCKDNNILSFSDLLEFAMIDKYDWFRVLCDSGAVIMEKYLKSRKWTVDSAVKNDEFISRVVDMRVQEELRKLQDVGGTT